MKRLRYHVALLAVSLVSATAPIAHAQVASYGPAAVVALVERLPHRDAQVTILRRANAEPHDVILVQENALTPRALSEAVLQLALIRRRDGDAPARDALFRVQARARALPLDVTAAKWVSALRVAKPGYVDGIGPARLAVVPVLRPSVK